MPELPKGSTVCRGQMVLELAKCGKASPPLPHKGQGRPPSLPLFTVPRVSPQRSLTYSPGSQGSSKRNPLPPGSPFLDFRTCKVQIRPQRRLPPTSRKQSRIFPARPPPTGSAAAGGEGRERGLLREDGLASLLEALGRLLLKQGGSGPQAQPFSGPNGPPPSFPAAAAASASQATWQACAAP